MDKNLALEAVRVTEAAALASARLMGRGDGKAADSAAVEAMRHTFDLLPIRGTVVIGEGERDEAPMLYIGERVGQGWKEADADAPRVDIAVDPLEGTGLCATGAPDALAVIALAENGKFLNAPDTYMDKIAVGREASGAIDLLKSPTWNLSAVAEAKKMRVAELTAVILDRPRHAELIAEVRKAGARIRLISDGDVAGAISTTASDETGIDILFGSGGAPEGVLAAAALRCTGGDMQGRLAFRNNDEVERARQMGITDPNRIYRVDDLAQGEVMFAATGVTNGALLPGVAFFARGARTTSLVMRSKSGTVRRIQATHDFSRKPNYWWLDVETAPRRARPTQSP